MQNDPPIKTCPNSYTYSLLGCKHCRHCNFLFFDKKKTKEELEKEIYKNGNP